MNIEFDGEYKRPKKRYRVWRSLLSGRTLGMPMDDLYYPEFEEPVLTDAPTVYVKLDIAREYLDLAMRCYIEQRDYFCAIHLAGAAEELLGQWLAPEDRISTAALKAHKQMTLLETGKTPSDGEARRYLNWSKNTIKHMDDGNPHIILDPVYEAGYWIEKALNNYYKIGFPKSPTLWAFEECRNREIVTLDPSTHTEANRA